MFEVNEDVALGLQSGGISHLHSFWYGNLPHSHSLSTVRSVNASGKIGLMCLPGTASRRVAFW